MKEKSPWNVCLKWGLVFGAASIVMEVVRMMARRLEMSNQAAGSLALIIIFVLILYAGIKEFKERYPARLSFSKAFLSCILIATVGCVILFGYELLHYTKIEPEGLEKRYENSLANYRAAIEKDTVTTVELQAYLDTLSVAMKTAEEQLVAAQDTVVDYAMRQEVQKGLGLVQKYYSASLMNEYQKRNVRVLDTLWDLSHFSMNARLELMHTLELYLNQNDKAPSSPYVREVVQRAENEMRAFSVADNRFEQKKANIPHYTSPVTYAAINSFFSWIYALLVGIFVALYHYRSKNAIDSVPVEETNPDDADAATEDEIENQEE
ncbi:MAG: DUF4199 domain-containing protein [Bacteroidales bacterium]|nr:DUF4199 domain-containing protein [Bacteroidales bacterium]